MLAKGLTREMGQLNQEGASLSASLLTLCQEAATEGAAEAAGLEAAAAASAASTASCGTIESVRLGTSAGLELVHLQSCHPMKHTQAPRHGPIKPWIDNHMCMHDD